MAFWNWRRVFVATSSIFSATISGWSSVPSRSRNIISVSACGPHDGGIESKIHLIMPFASLGSDMYGLMSRIIRLMRADTSSALQPSSSGAASMFLKAVSALSWVSIDIFAACSSMILSNICTPQT